jgi:hypothetical protein
MSFRTTTLLFALLLTVIWGFGLMLALRRSSLDPGLIMPKFAESSTITVDEVEISKDGKTYTFIKKGDKGDKGDESWRLKYPDSKDEFRVVDARINDLINEIRTAKHSNEDTDITNNFSQWGLDNPRLVVVLRDTKIEGGPKESKLLVGNESPDNAYVYVSTSERPRQVFAVKKSQLHKIFFKDINEFRNTRLLDSIESNVTQIHLKKQQDGKLINELSFVKNKDGVWRFKTPNYGPADYEGVPGADKDSGLRGLLLAVTGLKAESFSKPGDVTVTKEAADLVIEIEYEASKGKTKKEVVLIGAVPLGQKDRRYARMTADNSVVTVDTKQLEPVFAALEKPKSLRSHDLAQFSPSAVDAVFIDRFAPDTKNDEWVKVFRMGESEPEMPNLKDLKKFQPPPPSSGWVVFSSLTGPRKGSSRAIGDYSDPELGANVGLLAGLLGKREVSDKDFEDPDSPTKRKELDEKFDRKNLTAKVQIFTESLAPRERRLPEPKQKENTKAAVTLLFVKVGDEKVLVKREAPDTDPIYFHIKYSDFEKAVPRDMALALFDTDIRPFSASDAVKLTVVRGVGKEQETFVMERDITRNRRVHAPDKDKDKEADEVPFYSFDWRLKKPAEFADKADTSNTEAPRLISRLANLSAVRWVWKVKSKDDLDRYGLEVPAMTITVEFKGKGKEGDKDRPPPFKLLIGNKSFNEEDQGGYYAVQEGVDLVFVIDAGLHKYLKDVEFRDRTAIKFETAKVKEVKVRIPVGKEQKNYLAPVFERQGEKGWKLKEGVGSDFTPEPKRIEELLSKLSDLRVVRYLNVKTPPDNSRLGDKDARLIVEVLVEDGTNKTTHKLWVGAAKDPDDRDSPLFARCSDKEVIFLVPREVFEPMMKLQFFSK